MPGLKQFAINLLQKNPAVANKPMAQNALQVLQDGTDADIQQLGQNILDSRGLTLDQAKSDISKGWNIPL